MKNEKNVFCVIDEVLKGTNTIERIAASTEILKALVDGDALCITATHDIELCTLLNDKYLMYHFEEDIIDNELCYDYVIRKGPANSRNAIKLLEIMGFEKHIIECAYERANGYTRAKGTGD